ncbi:biogenesis of lysosome-related organelles complex 1 subunit 3 [Arapaima gigas]
MRGQRCTVLGSFLSFFQRDTDTSERFKASVKTHVMATNKYQVVVRGEASETDSDEELYITSVASAQSMAAGLKVPGEAPETDSDEEVDNRRNLVTTGSLENVQVFHMEIPPLVVTSDAKELNIEEPPAWKLEQGGRHNTLLQQKLQENNSRLYNDVKQLYAHVYNNAAKEIRGATTHLSSSQNGIIGASHSIRLILEDLNARGNTVSTELF